MFRQLLLALCIAALATPVMAKGSSRSRSVTRGKPSRSISSLFKPGKSSGLAKSSKSAPKPVKTRKSAAVYTPAATRSEAKSPTVYITDTGEKYHSAGCSSLRKSRIPISLKQARARGHEPCSRCGG